MAGIISLVVIKLRNSDEQARIAVCKSFWSHNRKFQNGPDNDDDTSTTSVVHRDYGGFLGS